MNRSLVRITVVLVLAIMLVGSGSLIVRNTRAQDASPTLPTAPDPELCKQEPRSIDDYTIISGTPEPTPPTIITAGRPADQATIDAITATMIEVAACINSGDLKRLDRLYTDAAFNGEVDQDTYNILATPFAPFPVGERNTIFAIALVQVLKDGRVAAIVQFQDNGVGGADLMIFAQQNGRYLIDQWVDGPFDIDPDFSAFQNDDATPTP